MTTTPRVGSGGSLLRAEDGVRPKYLDVLVNPPSGSVAHLDRAPAFEAEGSRRHTESKARPVAYSLGKSRGFRIYETTTGLAYELPSGMGASALVP